MEFSILIPTLVSRKETRVSLLRNLCGQIKPICEIMEDCDTYRIERFMGEKVEIIVVEDNKQITTGEKRNLLLKPETHGVGVLCNPPTRTNVPNRVSVIVCDHPY